MMAGEIMNDELDNNTFIEKHTEEFYGLEYEELDSEDDSDGIERPFDADKIRIDQQMLSLRYIYDLMRDGQINTSPDFQRNKVWKERKRKSLLIESLMLRIPIPAFYFYESEDSRFTVIDGQQRITTIFDFINNDFKLFGLEYLEDECGGKTFSQLDIKYQQRIFRTQLAVNILDARSPVNVVFDIFRRVNTGGVSLKPQEIRNAIAKGGVRKLLKDLFQSNEFQQATRGRIKDDRMDGQELVLRFIAFFKAYDYEKGLVKYNTGDLALFLDETLGFLNTLDNSEFKAYKDAFICSMIRSQQLFKEYAFRKCYFNSVANKVYGNIDIINKAMFTSWAVILANPKYNNIDFDVLSDIALKRLAYHLENDRYYSTYLTQGTNSTNAVNYTFYKANEILMEVFSSDR